jgi:hypothetical protein
MKYEIITNINLDGSEEQLLKRENADGSVSFIPMQEENSDYQAYLNPDLENGTIS